MTFRDLQKLIQSRGPGQSTALQCLQDKLFWINDPIKHKSKDRVTKDAIKFVQTNKEKLTTTTMATQKNNG